MWQTPFCVSCPILCLWRVQLIKSPAYDVCNSSKPVPMICASVFNLCHQWLSGLRQTSNTLKPPLTQFRSFQRVFFSSIVFSQTANLTIAQTPISLHIPTTDWPTSLPQKLHDDVSDALVEDEKHQTYSFIFLPIICCYFLLTHTLCFSSPYPFLLTLPHLPDRISIPLVSHGTA